MYLNTTEQEKEELASYQSDPCAAVSATGYKCTRSRGHEGRHLAGVGGGLACAAWEAPYVTREPVVEVEFTYTEDPEYGVFVDGTMVARFTPDDLPPVEKCSVASCTFHAVDHGACVHHQDA